MTQITGKQGTITFDVVTDDKESKQLLDQIVANTLQSLVNEDKARLLQKLSLPPPPKKLPSTPGPVSPAVKYARENVEEPILIALGGKWAYAIAIVSDDGGRAVRIAKGTIKGSWYRDKQTNEMILKPNDKMDPITLVNKINVKRLSEWNNLQAPVMSRLQAIESSRM